MPVIQIIRSIEAPVDRVFQTVANVRRFTDALPHATDLEFLTESEQGVGTRFRQTRVVNGKESTTELEITEHVENERVRMISDAGGTVWDTVFAVSPDGNQTLLTTTMEARAYKLLPKLMYPFIKGMIAKAIEQDMDLVKGYCESSNSGSS
jgi:carbon monoxide dehydrogenase subunit G